MSEQNDTDQGKRAAGRFGAATGAVVGAARQAEMLRRGINVLPATKWPKRSADVANKADGASALALLQAARPNLTQIKEARPTSP